MLLRQRDLDGRGGAALQVRHDLLPAAVLEGEGECVARGRIRGQGDIHPHQRPVDVRGEMQRTDIILAPRLQIDRLPDAAGVAVALLAVEMGVAGGIVGLDQQLLGLAETDPGQFALEGRVPALVRTNLTAVQPGRRLPVGGSDHQEYALALPLSRDRYLPPVPRHVAFVLHPGEFRPPGKWHRDAPVHRLERPASQSLGGRGAVEGERPVAVEVEPLGALEVRARMLRQGHLRAPRRAAQRNDSQCDEGEKAVSHMVNLFQVRGR